MSCYINVEKDVVMTAAWGCLVLAIAVEVGSSALLPRTEGFTNPFWAAIVLAGYAASTALLAVIVRVIPVSTAYAVWSGAGTAAVAIIGYLFLGESMSWIKAVSLTLIVIGVLGLNLAGGHAG